MQTEFFENNLSEPENIFRQMCLKWLKMASKNKIMALKYSLSPCIPTRLTIRRKLYAVKINPTSADACLIDFLVMI